MFRLKKYFLLVLLAVFLTACRENVFLSRKYFYGKLKKQREIGQFVPSEVNDPKLKPNLRLPITCSVFDVNIASIKQATDIKNFHSKKMGKVFLKSKRHGVILLKQKQVFSVSEKESKLKKTDEKQDGLKSGLVLALYWIALFSLSSNLIAIEITSLLISLQVVGIVMLAAVFFILFKYLFKLLYQKTR
jgi:hypothetical protein